MTPSAVRANATYRPGASLGLHIVTSCDDRACRSFGPGHNTHTVQATLAGTDPHGWREAVVDEVNEQCLTLTYLDDHGEVTVWHHQNLEPQVGVGDAVRLHPGRSLMEIGSQWLSVAASESE